MKKISKSDTPESRENSALSLIRSAAHSLPRAEAQVLIDQVARVSSEHRAVTGVVHTEPAQARLMCQLALEELGCANSSSRPLHVLDPACGSGVFLVEMLRLVVRKTGVSCRDAAVHSLFGADISVVAAEAARHIVALEAGDIGLVDDLAANIVCTNSLLEELRPVDIIIGNPPYVRSRNIPHAYRDRILRKLSEHLPARDLAGISGSSDLYVYFVLRGLSLLKDGGVLCFLVPNSWLDTVYGRGLRRILGANATVLGIYDFADTRPFSDALVNPCILLVRRVLPGPNSITRFISLPASTQFEDLHGLKGVEVRQSDTLLGPDACGVLMRAPSIYQVAVERARDVMVPLSRIARIRRGLTTGVNSFFYPSRAVIDQFQIEPEFLFPVIRSPRECRRIVVRETVDRVFICSKPRELLQGTGALRYIDWGESQGFHLRPSCAARPRWWTLHEMKPPDIAWVKAVDQTHRQCRLQKAMLIDQRLYGIYSTEPLSLNLILNSAFVYLFREVHGRTALGEGALDCAVVDVRSLPVPSPAILPAQVAAEIEERIGSRDILPVWEELRMPDRRELDEIVFRATGLSAGEGEAVCEEVIKLVRRRVDRAGSIPKIS